MRCRALHNPLVSEEGKEHAWNMLQQMDDEEARQELYHQQESPKDPTRVEAGLKAYDFQVLASELVVTIISARRKIHSLVRRVIAEPRTAYMRWNDGLIRRPQLAQG